LIIFEGENFKLRRLTPHTAYVFTGVA